MRLDLHNRRHAIEWQYPHPLATPRMYPTRDAGAPDVRVTAEAMLVFGVAEASAHVEARRMVHDPQAGSDANLAALGSFESGSLALVLNLTEACAVAGREVPNEAPIDVLFKVATEARAAAGAECVVLKHMTVGAVVVDATSGREAVPSFITPSVFPIGTGDIFSAVFAQRWAAEGVPAAQAALDASTAVASYVSERSEVIPRDLAVLRAGLTEAPRAADGPLPKIYLAAPFFTTPQRWLVEEALRALGSQSLSVFSPVHEVGLLARGQDTRAVATADLAALNNADLVFAVADGRDLGTLFEVGHAVAAGKPVIVLAEQLAEGELTMPKGSGCRIFSDFSTAVYHAGWAARTL